ncbi:MAG TPA: hypothetical protein DD613_03605 [Firmicutes bacterium]|nr:hypothetical protein [Bacillota bacterium]
MFLVINGIVVVFPILVYTFFIVYEENMKLEKSNIMLKISLFISMYLALYFKKYVGLNYQISCLILPIILSYLYNEGKVALILSTLLCLHSCFSLNYNIYTSIIFFLLLYLAYKKYSKSNMSSKFLINSSIVLMLIYFVANLIISYNDIVMLDEIISLIMYSLIIYAINYGINESKNIISLHMNLKEFEKEKNIKLNLFKITHEIKNPLTVVNGYLSMFDVTDIEKSKRYISILKNEVNRTLNLLSDFMEFTKIKVVKKECNFNDLISDVKEVLIPFFVKKNVSYSFCVQNNIIVNMDYNRIKQVIINVIKNAVEACRESNGMVTTTAFTEEDYLIIVVKDNGIGMDKFVLDNILVPFYTTKDNGTGLGVSLSKEILEAHGGTINYDSVKEKYTTCKITIPL